MVRFRFPHRALALVLVFLILMLSVFVGLEHHVCSDPHCAICCLLASRSERGLLALALVGTLVFVALQLLRTDTMSICLRQEWNLVEEKVKISC